MNNDPVDLVRWTASDVINTAVWGIVDLVVIIHITGLSFTRKGACILVVVKSMIVYNYHYYGVYITTFLIIEEIHYASPNGTVICKIHIGMYLLDVSHIQ